MLCQHDAVVHLVNVVAGQDDDVAHPVAFDDVDVLGDRIGGAEIPVSFIDTLGGGQHVEHLVAFGLKEAPATLQMADQAVGLVLGRHADAADAGVDRVGQREIDDPALAAEVHRRLRPPVRQLLQTPAPPPGEDESHRLAGQRARTPHCAHSFLPWFRCSRCRTCRGRIGLQPPNFLSPLSLPDCTRTARGSDVPAERKRRRRRHWFNLIIADLMPPAKKINVIYI